MSKDYPKIEAKVYNFVGTDLPTNSYIPLGTTNYGDFAPFVLYGPGGFLEHKQLNWTNLYLLNKLGSAVDKETGEVIDEICKTTDQKKIEKLIQKLPENLQKLMQQQKNLSEKIETLKQLDKSIHIQLLELKTELKEIKNSLEELRKGLTFHVSIQPESHDD